MLRKVETRRLTDAPSAAILAFDKEKMKECGFPTKEDYTVLYEDGKITIVKGLDMLEIKKTNMEKVISDMKEIKGEIPIKEDNCLQDSYDDYDKPRFVQEK